MTASLRQHTCSSLFLRNPDPTSSTIAATMHYLPQNRPPPQCPSTRPTPIPRDYGPWRPPPSARTKAVRKQHNTTSHRSYYRSSSTSTSYISAVTATAMSPNHDEVTETVVAATTVASASKVRHPWRLNRSPVMISTVAVATDTHLPRRWSLCLTRGDASLGSTGAHNMRRSPSMLDGQTPSGHEGC